MGVRNRHPLRDRDRERHEADLADLFGMEPFEGPIEVGDSDLGEVLISAETIVGFRVDDGFLPTVKGLLARPPTKRWVTVDMGAVPHVTNGADAMAPGIVDADEEIAEGDPVWIRDVDNEQPLAVGRALEDAAGMVAGESGKSVETLHHVGDKLFEMEV